MGSTRLITEVKSINPSFTINFKKMSQSVNLRVPKLVGSKWVYEYPVSKAAQKPNTEPEPSPVDSRHHPREIPRNYAQEPPVTSRNYSELSGYPREGYAREIPVETPKPAEKPTREDWRGPWPHDNLGPKPRLVGGKLVKPKFIDY